MINDEKEKEILSLLEEQKNNKLFMEVTGYISRLDSYIYKIEKENKQLKEQLEKNTLNHKQLKDLEKTQLLNSYQVEKINKLENQFKQRDEVIDEAIERIETLRMEKWAIMGTDIMGLLDILIKGKGYNNE